VYFIYRRQKDIDAFDSNKKSDRGFR